MEVHACDICNNILEGEIYILSVTRYPSLPLADRKFYETLNVVEMANKLQQLYPKYYKETDTKEICQNCFKILTYMFRIRMDELKKLAEELDRIERDNKNG